MKRRIALFAVMFAVSTLIGVQAVELVNGNPIPWPATPSQEKPAVTIKNLQNYTTYGLGSIALDFSVVQAQSWSVTYDFFFHIGEVKNITVALDGTLCGRFPYNSTDFSLLLNESALGMHKAEVTVFSLAYYTTPIDGIQNIRSNIMYDGNYLFENPIVVSDIIYFTTNSSSTDLPTHIPATPTSPPTATPSSKPTNDPTNNPTTNPTNNSNHTPSPTQTISPTPSPTLSQSMPTINTGPTLQVELNPPIIYIILAIVIVIMAVASGLLVYFKKRSQKLGGKE